VVRIVKSMVVSTDCELGRRPQRTLSGRNTQVGRTKAGMDSVCQIGLQSGPTDYEQGRRPPRTLSRTRMHVGGPKAENGSMFQTGFR
jgi:hypothetical protein